MALAIVTPVMADPVTGKPYITGGDSVSLPFRLFGIDAPEKRQQCRIKPGRSFPCGKRARAALKAMTGKARTISCERTGAMTYGRNVAVCYAGQTDIGLSMLEQGWALVYRRYLNQVPEVASAHIEAEQAAKAEGRGIWAGEFIKPERWRRAIAWRTAAAHVLHGCTGQFSDAATVL